MATPTINKPKIVNDVKAVLDSAETDIEATIETAANAVDISDTSDTKDSNAALSIMEAFGDNSPFNDADKSPTDWELKALEDGRIFGINHITGRRFLGIMSEFNSNMK